MLVVPKVSSPADLDKLGTKLADPVLQSEMKVCISNNPIFMYASVYVYMLDKGRKKRRAREREREGQRDRETERHLPTGGKAGSGGKLHDRTGLGAPLREGSAEEEEEEEQEETHERRTREHGTHVTQVGSPEVRNEF